ncbi:hypothetical protein GOP47_0019893 [Adiantum capillus-veneris]|uniref:DUF641 domain-containing protein n=1 Tax=Adiantum capillus-veneris TaxID=13818 RepID=A0A9D4Z7H2_ADICA|nr:hypothetical protein GOP47_0019893 [Adiantum capillus-veneris]
MAASDGDTVRLPHRPWPLSLCVNQTLIGGVSTQLRGSDLCFADYHQEIQMEPASVSSYSGNGNGFYKAFDMLSNQARLVNRKSVHKASAVAAAWDDFADGSETIMSHGSSGVITPSMEAEFADVEFADAESHSSSLSPSTANPTQLLLKVHVMEALISGIFSTVSSLKKAYVQFQSAHDPYDADKLQLADKAVVAELRNFSDLKQSYKKRLVILGSSESEGKALRVDMDADIKQGQSLVSYEAIINNFHSEIQSKGVIIESLQDKLSQMTLKKAKLEKQVKRLEQKVTRDSFLNTPIDHSSPSPQLLESAVLGASEASRTFAKLLVSLMKVAQWNLDAAANSIEPGISYLRTTHKKYVFESYVFQRMLDDFENGIGNIGLPHREEDCFKEFLEMRAMDPHKAVVSNKESSFGKYSLKRFVDLIHPKMELSFFGNLEHRKKISNGIHPESPFYQNFLKLSKAMWMLHLLAFSFKPNARIFQVKRNTEFSPLYMESIVRSPDMGLAGSESEDVPRVAFTIMPGFRVENVVIKCQVYIVAASEGKSKAT